MIETGMHDESAHAQPFLVFGSPLIGQAGIDEVVACMESAWLGTGPSVTPLDAGGRLRNDHAGVKS